MHDHDEESPKRNAIREGFVMLAGAVVLSPLLFILVDLVPSRENTSVDELPYLAFSAALIGLALAGVARIGYALITESRHPQLPSPTPIERSQPLERPEQLASPPVEPQPVQRLEHNTPV